MRAKRIKSLHISARRWCQRTYGNTYHKVTVYVNGETLRSVQEEYGGGDGFLSTAQTLLERAGYNTKLAPVCSELDPKGRFGKRYLTTLHLRETLHGTYDVADVARQKDM